MKRHWNCLKFIVKHKWFVLVAARKIKAPLWLAIIHDISKFRPSEWFPYAAAFYKPNGESQYIETPEFNKTWLMHQHRNPHHWQHWVLKMDSGLIIAIEMPKRYVLEMVADWMAAGRAITGLWEFKDWYIKNRKVMLLHKNTKQYIEEIIFNQYRG